MPDSHISRNHLTGLPAILAAVLIESPDRFYCFSHMPVVDDPAHILPREGLPAEPEESAGVDVTLILV